MANLQIKVDLATIKSTSTAISGKRSEMEGLARDMQALVDSLRECFNSTAGSKYIEKYTAVTRELNDCLENLQTHFNHLTLIEDEVRRLEGEQNTAVGNLSDKNIF